MPFKIVRNDITKMKTDAIVNTANEYPEVGPGCDRAVYEAAGYDELLSYRKEHIGYVKQGEAFLTPGFDLPAKYIIHAVSPLFVDGSSGEEELLRSCYRKSLALAKENGIRSIAFPLISTGSFGYPKEEGMRIAVDEIHAFLLSSNLLVYLVVFDEKATRMGKNLYPDLEAYIDHNYVEKKREEEYGRPWYPGAAAGNLPRESARADNTPVRKPGRRGFLQSVFRKDEEAEAKNSLMGGSFKEDAFPQAPTASFMSDDSAIEEMERKLSERMKHMADTFPEYLLYLISQKGMENSEVYKRAIVDKKVFSKIKNNPNYHPQKLTALCLCIGAKLNLDESKDLLARAGYALSPCDKTDIIFSYFIENEIYDMIELDIQLEEHGLNCIIS
ncbi:MAG: macro domain-containing protein [Lachnospiraceae bacterium]|nr:macro domain-containing protein [Lachnospiraceae bacterium]